MQPILSSRFVFGRVTLCWKPLRRALAFPLVACSPCASAGCCFVWKGSAGRLQPLRSRWLRLPLVAWGPCVRAGSCFLVAWGPCVRAGSCFLCGTRAGPLDSCSPCVRAGCCLPCVDLQFAMARCRAASKLPDWNDVLEWRMAPKLVPNETSTTCHSSQTDTSTWAQTSTTWDFS